MSVRALLDETGAAELTYWFAYLELADEVEFEKLKTFGVGGLA